MCGRDERPWPAQRGVLLPIPPAPNRGAHVPTWTVVGRPHDEFIRLERSEPRRTIADLKGAGFAEASGPMEPQPAKVIAGLRRTSERREVVLLVLQSVNQPTAAGLAR